MGGIPTPVPSAPLKGANDSRRKPIGLIITVVVLALLLCGAGGFGAWAYTEAQDYKLNVDEKVAAAVEVAKKETTEANQLQFAEESKNPLQTYAGPSAFGTIKVEYPKTWSGYIDTTGTGDAPLLALFHPDVVPATQQGEGQQAIALKIEVRQEAYDQVITNLSSFIELGELRAQPYALPKMKDQVGMKFTGKFSEQFKGTQIVLPLRDKTIVITTETDQYLADFNKYIVPNLSFVP